MKTAVSNNYKRCSHCAYATKYRGRCLSEPRYVCEDGREVQKNYVCDRWQGEIRDKEFFRRVDEALARMEPYAPGTYQIHEPIPLGTNYRHNKVTNPYREKLKTS